MSQHTRRLTRRGVLSVSLAAGLATLTGCSALGRDEEFRFPDGTPSDARKELARTFVERVHAEEYEAATEPFTDEMDESMRPEQLEQVWSQSVGDLGSYDEISRWGVIEGEEADGVFARVECQDGYYVLQVTVRGEQIAGLFFKDKSSA